LTPSNKALENSIFRNLKKREDNSSSKHNSHKELYFPRKTYHPLETYKRPFGRWNTGCIQSNTVTMQVKSKEETHL
jgi:hypothetical protein